MILDFKKRIDTGIQTVFGGLGAKADLSPVPCAPAWDCSKSPNLDFLRACAVVAVFVGHLLQTLHVDTIGRFVTIYDMAQTGVLIFFVHTSLVLLLSLDRQHRAGARLFVNFYVRRVFRIYPLAMVVIAAMVFGHLPAFPTLAYTPPAWTTVATNLALIQNLTATPSLYAPLWSLPYEVQMYFFLPFLFIFLGKRRQFQWLPLALWAMIVGLIVMFAAMRIRGTSLLSYFPCFLAGVVAYHRWAGSKRHLPYWVWPLVIVGCVLLRTIVRACAGPEAVLPVGWVACLTLGWSIPLIGEIPLRWLQQTASKIAKYSYGVYLSHAVVLWLAFVALRGAPLALQIGVWLIGSVGLPVLLYHAVEQPMLGLGIRIANGMTLDAGRSKECGGSAIVCR